MKIQCRYKKQMRKRLQENKTNIFGSISDTSNKAIFVPANNTKGKLRFLILPM